MLPPFTALRSVQTLIDGDKLRISYGAQDLSPYDSGAYTGDISGPMLAKLGCDYVLAGHSERRQYHAETDELVNAKVQAALRSELTPILCVGESLEVRKAGEQLGYCIGQLDGSLKGIPATAVAAMVIAYEPVWAIGTGEVATPQDAQEVAAAIRSRISEIHDAETAAVCVSCMAGPSSPATSRRSWRSRTSTAPSSAAPASTPGSSLRSAGIVNWQRRLRSAAPLSSAGDG